MRETVLKAILLSVFFGGGALMLLLGVLIGRRLWSGGSVEVEAECIDLNEHTEVLGVGVEHRTCFPNAKRPVYRYAYGGRQYVSGPRLSSNRLGYRPKLGCCTIRIDPDHPEKVYSPERKYAALILIAVGFLWIAVASLTALIFLARI